MKKQILGFYGRKDIRLYGFIALFFLLIVLITLSPYNPITPRLAHAAIQGAAGITLSPPVTELTIKRGEQANGSIKLTNPLNQLVELYTSTADFLAEGETGGQKFLEPTSENRKFSLAGWMGVQKSKVAIMPDQVEEVKYTISVPQDAEPCGHYAVIFFNSQPPKPESGKTEIAIGSQVGALFLVNVPETTAGECRQSAAVETFTAPWFNFKPPINFLTRIYNSGTLHIKPVGEIKIKNWAGTIIDSIKINEAGGNILPISTRKFENEWKPEKMAIGRYKAELSLVYGQSGALKSLASQTVFWIMPWWTLAGGGVVLVLVIFFITRWIIIRKNRIPRYDTTQGGHKRVILR